MVGDTLGVGRKRQVLCADVGSTLTVSQTRDVIFAHFVGDVVDFFFDCVGVVKTVKVCVDVRFHRLLEQVLDMLLQIAYFTHGFV